MIGAARSVGLISVLMLVGGALTGCGDSGSSGSASTPATVNANPVFPIDRAPSSGASVPTISGIPSTTAVAGQPYTFQAKAANTGNASVSFSVQHAPAWARFDTATGTLSGTPSSAQVGKYSDISITLLAGKTSVTLPAFTITVATASQANAVTLSWEPPTENADGTRLKDLTGYRVHYGPASKAYSDTIQVSNPGITTYVVENLNTGKYYFAVTAFNAAGQESSFSPEVSTQVD